LIPQREFRMSETATESPCPRADSPPNRAGRQRPATPRSAPPARRRSPSGSSAPGRREGEPNARARLQEIEDRDKSEVQKASERGPRPSSAPPQWCSAPPRPKSGPSPLDLRDPSDAAAFLDRDFVDDDGDIDSKGIEKALADLLKRKPHLGKEQPAAPSFDGGARTTAGAPTDMNALIRRRRASADPSPARQGPAG
jgi:hypothetical protein